MNSEQMILRAVGVAAVFGLALTACDNGAPPDETAVAAAEESAGAENPESGETITVRGVLQHFPQDVKSPEAWLGHEFVVGEAPIRPTEAVPAEKLRKMVGETVEIAGAWNAGEKWEPPQPADEEFHLQQPSYPEGVTVIRDAGIDASSVRKLEP